MVIKRENTITLDFKKVKKKPPNSNIHRWIKDKFGFKVDQVTCIQFDHLRFKIYVKLISEILVKQAVQKYEQEQLTYSDEGNEYEIFVTEESEDTIVKVFDFPPELSNSKLKEAFEKYGCVKNIKNEMWSGNDLYAVESGVRILTMGLKRNIPSYVTIDGITSLVTYKNQERTCLICECPGHERRDCPSKPVNRVQIIRRPPAPMVDPISNTSYADVLNSGIVHQNEVGRSVENPKDDASTTIPIDETPDTFVEDRNEQYQSNEDVVMGTQADHLPNPKPKRKRNDKPKVSSSEEERKIPKLTIQMKENKVKIIEKDVKTDSDQGRYQGRQNAEKENMEGSKEKDSTDDSDLF